MSFDEFLNQKGKEQDRIPQEGDVKKNKEEEIYLDPDAQNPTSQSDSATGWSVGYPFGGI
jgi:hypothetical protein